MPLNRRRWKIAPCIALMLAFQPVRVSSFVCLKKNKICFPQKVCALSLTITTSPTMPAVMRLLCRSLCQSRTSTLVLANLGLRRASVKAVRATSERRILQLEYMVSSLLTLQHTLASPKGANVKERFWASICQAFA